MKTLKKKINMTGIAFGLGAILFMGSQTAQADSFNDAPFTANIAVSSPSSDAGSNFQFASGATQSNTTIKTSGTRHLDINELDPQSQGVLAGFGLFALYEIFHTGGSSSSTRSSLLVPKTPAPVPEFSTSASFGLLALLGLGVTLRHKRRVVA